MFAERGKMRRTGPAAAPSFRPLDHWMPGVQAILALTAFPNLARAHSSGLCGPASGACTVSIAS
jgi:hypothetical protein